MPNESIAFITPSYAPDFSRCQKLCQSLDTFAPNFEHIIIVNKFDYELFSTLKNTPNRKIVLVEDVLPTGYKKIPFTKKWWLDPYFYPVRGWITQQLTKIAAATITNSEVVIFLDSDIRFFKPIRLNDIYHKDQVRLLKTDCKAPSPLHSKWLIHSEKDLGLTHETFHRDYVGPIVTWRRSKVLSMIEHIEKTTNKKWFRALGHRLTFSEYTLYGNYVERVLNKDCGHFTTDKQLCLNIWSKNDADDILNGRKSIEPQMCAVLIQSNLNLSDEEEDKLFNRLVEHVRDHGYAT